MYYIMRGRHLKAILALSITFLIIIGLAGCSLFGWTNAAPGSVVGTWQLTRPPDSFTMTLTSGLTFTQLGVVGTTSFDSSGTYASDDSSIVFTTDHVSGIPVPAFDDPADYSLSPNGNSMILAYRSGTPPAFPLSRQ